MVAFAPQKRAPKLSNSLVHSPLWVNDLVRTAPPVRHLELPPGMYPVERTPPDSASRTAQVVVGASSRSVPMHTTDLSAVALAKVDVPLSAEERIRELGGILAAG